MARNRLEIRLDLIRQNYTTIKNTVSPLCAMAVLKADGYGLGAISLRNALKKEGCSKFGVADVEEALEVCDGESDIYVLGDLLPDEIASAVEGGFILPLTSLENALLISKEALKQNRVVRCQVLLDTGMGRLGIIYSESLGVIAEINELPGLELLGIYSHFPHAYGDIEFSAIQVERFKEIIHQLSVNGIEFDEVHMANSDGIHNVSTALKEPFNIARTGINLYGCFDLEGKRRVELSQVVKLISRLVAVRRLPKGFSVGYGRTFPLKEDKLVGTVAIGYADGLPISLSNSGSLVIRGVKCPIIGRVSMDYTTVDLSELPDAKPGEEVVCLGDDISINDWAISSGTIPYDIICSIGNRVKRSYID